MKLLKHLKTVLIHKIWVFYYMNKLGMPLAGLKHDMSKFMPSELFASARYYSKGQSPIGAEREDLGYSTIWMHHRGRNPHHFQYWIDYDGMDTYVIMMPYRYAAEMVCDMVAASRVYEGKNFSNEKPVAFWDANFKRQGIMHPSTRLFVNDCLRSFSRAGEKSFNQENFQKLYNSTCLWFPTKMSFEESIKKNPFVY